MSLPEQLKTLRVSHHMTQEELGRQINVARATIAGYETRNRQPSYENLTAIANVFHVSLDFLLGNANDFLTLESASSEERILDEKFSRIYHSLSPTVKKELYRYLLFLDQQEKKNP